MLTILVSSFKIQFKRHTLPNLVSINTNVPSKPVCVRAIVVHKSISDCQWVVPQNIHILLISFAITIYILEWLKMEMYKIIQIGINGFIGLSNILFKFIWCNKICLSFMSNIINDVDTMIIIVHSNEFIHPIIYTL